MTIFNDETNEEHIEQVTEEDTTSDDTNDHDTDDSSGEGEGAAEGEAPKQRQPETPEAKRARLKRQLAQLDKKHGFKDEDGGDDGSKGADGTIQERFDRQDLKLIGITNKKEQDIVIDYAKWKGIGVEEAAGKAAVKAELEQLRAKATTPKPSTRSGTGESNDIAYWKGQVRKGNFPKDPELLRKLRKEGVFR